MARLPRLYADGIPQHIIQRGNNRQNCFFDSLDKRIYIKYLNRASNSEGVAIHAYVLMSNHIHILATPQTEKSCPRMMQSLGVRYVTYFNKRHKRTGTLWDGRYKATLVDTDRYFFTVSRYIELNPVRAEMTTHPSDYAWSSYRHNAQGKQDNVITPHDLCMGLGSTPHMRHAAYANFFDKPVAPEQIDRIRTATNNAWVLGDDEFLSSLGNKLSRRARSLGHGGNRRSRGQTP